MMSTALSGNNLTETYWDALTDEVSSVEEARTYVTFDLAGQSFAADVACVREILDVQHVCTLPNAPSDVIGMIDVRGEGVAVVDLPSRLGLLAASSEGNRRIVVLELGDDPAIPVGIIADQVHDVRSLPTSSFEPVPRTPGHWDASNLEGVARIEGRLVYVLAIDRLFSNGIAGPFDFD